MIIERIINNNVVSTLDEEGKEIVLMGRGIGYGKRKGQACENARIEKVFRMEDESALERFKNLLSQLPLEYIEVSDDIISYAKKELGIPLNQNIYLTLTDHISFALERLKKGMIFTNALHSEIRRFYPAEYAIGLHALQIVREKTGIRLPEDEAASIAQHLVNAEFNLRMQDAIQMTDAMGKMANILSSYLPFLEEESLEKDRLLSELKFMAHRILRMEPRKEKSDGHLYAFMQSAAPELLEAADAVAKFWEDSYDRHMTQEERLYLAVAIKRIQDLYQKES